MIAPLHSGAITQADITGDLAALCRAQVSGRTSNQTITLFKAVGTGLADIATASLIYDKSQNALFAQH